MKFVGAPSEWLVTLADGHVIRIWADSVSTANPQGSSEPTRFSALMDIAPEDQQWFRVEGRTANNAERVIVTVAELPSAAIASLRSA